MSSSLRWVTGIGSDLLDLHLVTIDGAASLLNQLLGDSLSLKCDKTKVLGLIVLHLVNGSDDLGNVTKLTEVFLDLVFTNTRVWQLSDVHFAWFDVSFLDSNSLTLELVFCTISSSVY